MDIRVSDGWLLVLLTSSIAGAAQAQDTAMTDTASAAAGVASAALANATAVVGTATAPPAPTPAETMMTDAVTTTVMTSTMQEWPADRARDSSPPPPQPDGGDRKGLSQEQLRDQANDLVSP